MSKKYYVTTPIYYVNDKPHIGHAYTTIAADVLARYQRACGQEVFFLTGTDEHGQKIDEAAAKNGKSPQEFVDGLVPAFKAAWEKLNISYDHFIRTTDQTHKSAVQGIIEKLYANGDIYLGEYEGLYCSGCEQFYLEKDLAEGNKCPVHGTVVKYVKEPSYFFKLSRFQDKLLEFYEKNPNFIMPLFRRDEVLNRVKDGLKDLSISRKNLKWGIPFPLDQEHVVYVWFEALCNYLTGLGWPENIKSFEKFWPADVHLIGKEINWFHSVIWPAILMSLELPLPKKVFAHGWWTVEGEKMSKSLGNVIDPIKLADEYGVDPVRYFLLREIPFGQDGNFSIDNFRSRYNTDLANDFGNLLNRTLNMCHKYFAGIVPQPGAPVDDHDKELAALKEDLFNKTAKAFAELSFTTVLDSIWEVIKRSNKYIEIKAPWTLAKENKQEELSAVIYLLLESLRLCAVAVAPFMPATAEKMLVQLNAEKEKSLLPGNSIGQPEPLFPRLEK